jgi:hypothetical protein
MLAVEIQFPFCFSILHNRALQRARFFALRCKSKVIFSDGSAYMKTVGETLNFLLSSLI